MKYLIVGLGNPGEEYHETRHNIGFMVLDSMAKDAEQKFIVDRHAHKMELKYKGRILILIKPTTYMNLSGKALQYWMQAEKIALENVLVIVDDLALPFGSLRFRQNGSDAGHNGLKDINATLGTQNYARLRFGIGNNYPKGQQADYVLGKFAKEEQPLLPEKIKLASDIVKSFCTVGPVFTMNTYNKK